MQNNEIKDKFGDLLSQALIPSSVWDEQSIKPRQTDRNEPKHQNNKNNNSGHIVEQHERRGSLLVRTLWEQSKYCIIDVRITHANQPSYINRCPTKIIQIFWKKKMQDT